MQIDESIESYEKQLNKVAEVLDQVLISRYGEDAAWENYVGDVRPPTSMGVSPADVLLWQLREECNSTLHWEQNEHPEA